MKLGISNIFIDETLRQLPLTNYYGCFSADTIPLNRLENPFSFICNLSPSTEEGTHFIACHGDEWELSVFDSFGDYSLLISEPLQRILTRISLSHGIHLRSVLMKSIQDFRSEYCGFLRNVLHTVSEPRE